MCGGFVGDVLDTVGDAIEDVGDFIGDTVEAIVDDPLQAIVTVGAMAMGVPPVWAGALGGAAGAAEDGGNILEGALLGGATGYVGGLAGSAAAGAGAGEILSGAAGGAAAGATGAALTGNDIVGGALTGGFLGGASGAAQQYFNPSTGNTTYTFDDGSTITRDAGSNVVGSTPSPYQPAPVVDLSTPAGGGSTGGSGTPVNYEIGYGPVAPTAPIDLVSTGMSDSSAGTVYNGPNGPEVVLDSGKTVLLSDYMAAIESGGPISVDGNMQTDFRVESSGLPRSSENPGTGNLPEGTELASIENSNGAKWDDTLETYVNPTTGAYFDQASNAWVQPAGTPIEVTGGNDGYGPPSNYVAPVSVNPDGSTTTVNWNGSITTTYADGTSVTNNPDGSSVTRDTTGTSHVGGTGGTGGTGAGVDMGNGSTTYTYDDGSSITIHPDGTATSTPAPADVPEITITDTRPTTGTTTPPVDDVPEITITDTRPTTGVGGVDLITTPVVETPTPPVDIVDPYNPGGWTPTPVTPIFPIVTPKPPVTPPPTTPPTVITPGTPLPDLRIPTGLNPGWIEPPPFYNTTSPVQSQYYWGGHGYQEGPTFNAQQYNTVPNAPQAPWGLQEMAPVARPQDLVDYINSPEYQAQFVSGPVAPVRG
jgi:hypothetical protein